MNFTNIGDDNDRFLFSLVEKMEFSSRVSDNATSIGTTHRASIGIPIAYRVDNAMAREKMLERLKLFSNEAVNNAEVLASEIYPNIHIDPNLMTDVTNFFTRIAERIMSNEVPYKGTLLEVEEADKVEVRELKRIFSISINFTLHEKQFGKIQLDNPGINWYIASWNVVYDEDKNIWVSTTRVEDSFDIERMDKLNKS